MTSAQRLDSIEAGLAEIERIDRETRGVFRQAQDREAFDLVCRIERQMLLKDVTRQ